MDSIFVAYSREGCIDVSFLEVQISNLREKLIKYKKYYNKEYKIIVDLSLELERFKKFNQNPFLQILFFQEEDYAYVVKKKQISQKIEVVLKKVFNHFEEIRKEWNLLEKDFVNSELIPLVKKTLLEETNQINNMLVKIQEAQVIFSAISYYDYLKRKFFIDEKLDKIIQLLYIMQNQLKDDGCYIYDIDLSSLKNLSCKDLEIGDILLLHKADSILTPYRKFLKMMISSNIMHSALVYDIRKDVVYVLEANSTNSQRVRVDQLELKEGFTYIVLRNSKKLTKLQKEKLIFEANKTLEEEFSNLKLVVGVLERMYEYFLRNLSFVKRKKNPFWFLNGTFCSEVIARVYKKINLPLGVNLDTSMTSPIDILNSKNLKIIGKIK
jgi:hypothetical protein